MDEPIRLSNTPFGAAPPDPGRARTRQNQLEDPKKLYRLLEKVLLGSGSADAPPRLEHLVEEFLHGFRADLGLRGAVLYRERRGRFHRLAWYGEDVEAAVTEFDTNHPWVRRLVRDRVTVTAPGHGAPGLAELGFPPRPLAGVLLAEPRVRHLLAFPLEEGVPPGLVDFVLNTLRSVLGAQVLQARWHSALAEAAEIQRQILPARPPRFPGYDVAGRSVAAEEVGGDFFDFVPERTDVLGLAIGDASGHGLPAALVARDVLVGLRMGAEQEMKLVQLLRRLNRVVRWNHQSASFVSLFYGELEPGGHLVYVNAGQPPPLLVTSTRTRRLSTGDAVLGPIADVAFSRHFERLEPGAVLVLYSDGIVERLDAGGTLFGEGRLEQVIREHARRPAASVLEAVFDAATRHGNDGPWEDDATVVVVRRRT